MNTYDYIKEKINGMKAQYPSLRDKTDDYIFSALCIKANFYKSPALVLHEEDFAEMIADGRADGGADILLTDPNSEGSDLVIGQSKFYKTISSEQVINAMYKMADFYNDMTAGHYERFNEQVRSRFHKLYDELGNELKVHFVFYKTHGINLLSLNLRYHINSGKFFNCQWWPNELCASQKRTH